jgi:hypothetical protein
MSSKNSKILFLIDTTGSMGAYINSLRNSIIQLSYLVRLLGTDTKVAILGYKDQSDRYPVIWSKWIDPSDKTLFNFLDNLYAEGGSNDFCETSKLAISIAIEECANTDSSFVIHYTDAPPHCESYYFGSYSSLAGNDVKEKKTLVSLGYPYDWIEICKKVHSKKLSIVTLYSKNAIYQVDKNIVMAYYALLGQVIYLEHPGIQMITKTTIDVILSQFNGSVITPHRSFELNKAFANEKELGSKDAIPMLEEFEYYPKFKVFNTFPTVNELIKKFKDAPSKITDRHSYRDTVYEILGSVMNTKDGIISLTYNPIFGSLWRIVAAFARVDPRSVELSAKLSREMSKLDSSSLTIVKEWLEESYNKEDEVHEIIKSANNFCDDSKVFIIDMKEPVTKRQLMDVMRGTSDSTSTGKVIQFLSTIQTIEYKNIPVYKKEKMYYIPVDLPSDKIMSIISHLISPGIIMSTRPAAVLSILVCLVLEPTSELYKHASNNLENERSLWIDVNKQELSDNYSIQFINIINQLRSKPDFPEFLSADETRFYNNITSLIKIIKNLNKYISVKRPYTTKNKKMCQYDHVVKCISCNKFRSFTIMNTASQCGPCYLIDSDPTDIVKKTATLNKIKCYNSSLTDTIRSLRNLPSQLDDKTNLFTCESCKSYYSVISIGELNVKPKCHFCRTNEIYIPISTCKICSNNFVDEANLLNKFNGICGQCTYSDESFEELKITIGDFFKKSPGLLRLFGISQTSVGYLSSTKSIYKACTSNPPDVYFVPQEDEPDDKYFWSNAYYKQHAILQILKTEINEGITETECLLCFNVFPLKDLKPSCGNCTHQLCESCAKGWYSQNSPGNIVLETYSRCPFCKQAPKFDVIKNYNRVLCQFNNRKHVFSNTAYEAWCLKCGSINDFAEKECANDIPSLKGEYRCQVCKIKDDKLDPSDFQKECPGCSVMCYKSGGCNHMTCTLCSAHWCWVCRWKSEPGKVGIYDHLEDVHGGIYDFDQHHSDDSSDDDDDDYYDY